jgi:hypothetical protein
LENVLDAADPIEADDEYHVEEVIGSMESSDKVTYLVKWRGFPAKKNWTRDIYEIFYSLRAKKQLKKFNSNNPKAPRDAAFKIKK